MPQTPATNTKLKNLRHEAEERRRNLVLIDDRAIGDCAAESLVLHEGIESPSRGDGVRVAELDEWTERRSGFIQIVDPIVIAHDFGAFPCHPRAEHQRMLSLDDRGSDGSAHLIAVMTS